MLYHFLWDPSWRGLMMEVKLGMNLSTLLTMPRNLLKFSPDKMHLLLCNLYAFADNLMSHECDCVKTHFKFCKVEFERHLSNSTRTRFSYSSWVQPNITSSIMMAVPSMPRKYSSIFFCKISEAEFKPNRSFH